MNDDHDSEHGHSHDNDHAHDNDHHDNDHHDNDHHDNDHHGNGHHDNDHHGNGHHDNDHHDSDHHDETAADPRPRVRAIQSLLVEKGLVSTDAIDEAIAAYERDIGPQNGAHVVARAWTDPDFEERLLEDAPAALEAFGFEFDVGIQHIDVKKNTEDVHNAVVCTLCSCYPWSLLGLPPTWYKTPSYRSRMVREPRAVLEEFGLELDDGIDVDVWDSSSEIRYMVLPRRPEGTDGYDEDELAELVTRDAMIGVERLDGHGSADGDGDADASSEPTADGGHADATSAFADLLGIDAEPTFSEPWQARAFGVTVALYDDGDGFDWSAFQRRLIDAVEATPSDAYATDGDRERDGRVTGTGTETDTGTETGAGAGTETSETAAATERIYYDQWHTALERLLVSHDALASDAIDDRAAEFAAGDRTAEEFVAGDRAH